MQFGLTVTSVLTLIAMCVPGYLLIRSKLLKEEAIAILSAVLLYVNQPAFSFYSFQSQPYSRAILGNILTVAAISILIHLIVLFASFFIFRCDRNKFRGRAYAFASGFGNIGFMGLPVIRMLMPDNPEVVIYLAPTIAFFAAFPLFIFNVAVPQAVLFPIKYLSDMIVPMAMLILGMRFGATDMRGLFSDWGLYVSSFIKLIITPLLAYLMMKLARLDQTVFTTVFILMAMPAANMGLIIAEKFGGDREASAKAVLGSSLISIITIPLVLLML